MRLRNLLLWSCTACLLTACTAEEMPGGNQQPDGTEQQPVAPGETGLFTFGFDAGTFATVDTRVISNDAALNDIWVVQLNAAGTAALVPPVQVTSIGSDKKIRVKLKAEASKVYFFANTGNASLFNTSAALNTFTTSSVEATNISAGVNWGNMSYTPMFGTWPATGTGTPTTPTISGTTELTRCLSHVSVTVKNETGGNLAISSIQLKNVPNVLQLCPSTASAYPAATGTYLDYSATTSRTLSYYVAENCRGTGSGRYETEKTASAVTGGAYATYVEVKGKYKNMIDVTYRFYLGGNATNDYNVRRNTKYTVTTTIKGMNETDMRVTIDTPSYSTSSNTDATWGDGSSENVDGTI